MGTASFLLYSVIMLVKDFQPNAYPGVPGGGGKMDSVSTWEWWKECLSIVNLTVICQVLFGYMRPESHF